MGRKRRKARTASAEDRRVSNPYDAAAKQLLACRPILAFVLKNTIEELVDCTIEEIGNELIDGEVGVSAVPVHARGLRSPLVWGLRNEDVSVDEGSIRYDILLRVRKPGGDGSMGIIVNLEPQSYETNYPVLGRAMYYCARLLSAQRGWGRAASDYGALEKVYSIWLFTGPHAPEEGSVTRYSFQERTVCGSLTYPKSEYDLSEVVLVQLPQAGGYNGFLERLATLFSLETSRGEKLRALEGGLTWGLEEAEELVGRLVSMGEYALEYGMEKGLAQGLEEGLAQGREEARVDSIRALMASTGWDIARAMDALGIQGEERARCEELLTKQG